MYENMQGKTPGVNQIRELLEAVEERNVIKANVFKPYDINRFFPLDKLYREVKEKMTMAQVVALTSIVRRSFRKVDGDTPGNNMIGDPKEYRGSFERMKEFTNQ